MIGQFYTSNVLPDFWNIYFLQSSVKRKLAPAATHQQREITATSPYGIYRCRDYMFRNEPAMGKICPIHFWRFTQIWHVVKRRKPVYTQMNT
jgi:hypothetical protein